MRVTVLGRGGLSVFGGWYDPHRDEAIVPVRDGETVGVSIDYPSAPSAITTSVSGMTTTTPAISGTLASLTLSAMSDASHIDITSTVGGEIRTVRIRAKSQATIDRYDCGFELTGS